MTTPGKNNFLPPGLVSNLQDVLNKKKGNNNPPVEDNDDVDKSKDNDESVVVVVDEFDPSKPVIFATNSDGIDSPGLIALVDELVGLGKYNVSVCAPQLDKSLSGHSFSHTESIAVHSAEIKGAAAYEVSGTPVDCVSLALSGALFAWSKPLLVIVGVHKGPSCGHDMFSSSAVAGARQALISGVPSLSVSLNWKKDESEESHFKDAVSVCMPLIKAAIRDVEKGVFPKTSSLHITVPTSPTENKGFKLTKQSLWRSKPTWQAIAANRNPSAALFMANQPGMGLQLAQLGRDASAAGAARRLNSQKKSLEVVESVGVSGKVDPKRIVKYFRLEVSFKTLTRKTLMRILILEPFKTDFGKRLFAGDSVLFIRDEKQQLLLGIRRANRQPANLSSAVLSSHSMHIGILAAAAHAAANNSPFTVFFNPR